MTKRQFIRGLTVYLMAFGVSSTSMNASAKNTSKQSATPPPQALDIRPVQDSSIDVFEVLSRIPKADEAFKNGDYAAALEHYRYVYFHDPKQSRAAIGYADAALALGRPRLAMDIYAGISDENTRVKNGLLLAQILDGQYENPKATLQTYLQSSPGDARLWNMLGRMLDKDNQGLAARKAYETAHHAGQRAGLAANNIGQSFLTQGHMDEALTYFTQASFEAPQNPLFDNNRRLVLLLQKDYAQALSQLSSERAATLLKDAAIIAQGQSETRLAIYFLEKSISLSPVYDKEAETYLARLSQ